MKKIFNKVAYFLVIFMVGAIGGMATISFINYTDVKKEELCKAEAMSECLLSDNDARHCITEANAICK